MRSDADSSQNCLYAIAEDWDRMTLFQKLLVWGMVSWMSSKRKRVALLVMIVSAAMLAVSIAAQSWVFALAVGVLLGWAVGEFIDIYRHR